MGGGADLLQLLGREFHGVGGLEIGISGGLHEVQGGEDTRIAAVRENLPLHGAEVAVHGGIRVVLHDEAIHVDHRDGHEEDQEDGQQSPREVHPRKDLAEDHRHEADRQQKHQPGGVGALVGHAVGVHVEEHLGHGGGDEDEGGEGHDRHVDAGDGVGTVTVGLVGVFGAALGEKRCAQRQDGVDDRHRQKLEEALPCVVREGQLLGAHACEGGYVVVPLGDEEDDIDDQDGGEGRRHHSHGEDVGTVGLGGRGGIGGSLGGVGLLALFVLAREDRAEHQCAHEDAQTDIAELAEDLVRREDLVQDVVHDIGEALVIGQKQAHDEGGDDGHGQTQQDPTEGRASLAGAGRAVGVLSCAEEGGEEIGGGFEGHGEGGVQQFTHKILSRGALAGVARGREDQVEPGKAVPEEHTVDDGLVGGQHHGQGEGEAYDNGDDPPRREPAAHGLAGEQDGTAREEDDLKAEGQKGMLHDGSHRPEEVARDPEDEGEDKVGGGVGVGGLGGGGSGGRVGVRSGIGGRGRSVVHGAFLSL